MTWDVAFAAGRELEQGSIAAGKTADFVVLDRDIMTVAAEDILGAKVIATFLDGNAVHVLKSTEAAASSDLVGVNGQKVTLGALAEARRAGKALCWSDIDMVRR